MSKVVFYENEVELKKVIDENINKLRNQSLELEHMYKIKNITTNTNSACQLAMYDTIYLSKRLKYLRDINKVNKLIHIYNKTGKHENVIQADLI